MSQYVCPHPKEFQEKAARLGWAGWIPTPGVTDEDKELYITLGKRHVHVMSIDEVLVLSDEALQRRIEDAIGMTVEQASEQYGINPDEVVGGVRYPQSEVNE